MDTQTPTVDELEAEVLQKMKEFQFEAGDALVSQSIFIPIFERYEGIDDLSDIIEMVLSSMKTKGYIEDKGESTFLTQAGYEASLKSD